MAQANFVHMACFAHGGVGGAAFILAEAARDPAACTHIADPQLPIPVAGLPLADLRAEYARLAAAARETTRQGRKRLMRSTQRSLLGAIASYPVPMAELDGEAAWGAYVFWRDRAAAFLMGLAERHGALCSIVEHRDEANPHLHAIIVPTDAAMRAKFLHPGYAARLTKEEAALRAGESPKDAAKVGRRAYGRAMRDFQDAYHREVGVPCGHARIILGRMRSRLKRGERLAIKEVHASRDAAMAARDQALRERDEIVAVATEEGYALGLENARQARETKVSQETNSLSAELTASKAEIISLRNALQAAGLHLPDCMILARKGGPVNGTNVHRSYEVVTPWQAPSSVFDAPEDEGASWQTSVSAPSTSGAEALVESVDTDGQDEGHTVTDATHEQSDVIVPSYDGPSLTSRETSLATAKLDTAPDHLSEGEVAYASWVARIERGQDQLDAKLTELRRGPPLPPNRWPALAQAQEHLDVASAEKKAAEKALDIAEAHRETIGKNWLRDRLAPITGKPTMAMAEAMVRAAQTTLTKATEKRRAALATVQQVHDLREQEGVAFKAASHDDTQRNAQAVRDLEAKQALLTGCLLVLKRQPELALGGRLAIERIMDGLRSIDSTRAFAPASHPGLEQNQDQSDADFGAFDPSVALAKTRAF